jgi:excisionase family DNA binding protein
LKTELEPADIEAIAQRVSELIKSQNSCQCKHDKKETIFTPESLAEYLQVDTSWIYRQVSNKGIPYFKNGKYVRFRKSSIDKWIASSERQPIPQFNKLKSFR